MAGANDQELTYADRFVCVACRGVYFAPVNDRCPGCKGAMKVETVGYDAAGVAHVKSASD